MNTRIYLLTAFLTSFGLVQAQSSRHVWGLTIAPSASSFYALQDGSSITKIEDYGGAINFNLYRRAGSAFDIGLETSLGRVRHPFDTEATRASERDNFFHTQLGIRFRLDNGFILKKDALFAPYLRSGFGTNSYKNFDEWLLHVPIGLGFNIRIPKTQLAINLQSTYNLGIMESPSFLHHSLGVTFEFGKKSKKAAPQPEKKVTDDDKKLSADNKKNPNAAPDRDYDGVPDETDRCPDINGTSLTGGCPDQDSDGVPDNDDKCIEEKGYANLLGCNDSDHDGVIDPEDQCPEVYGEVPSGCPASDENDLDADGVPNEKDLCPNEKGSFTADGCPDQDGDGIADNVDECKDYFGNVEFKGCPLPKAELEAMRKQYDNEQADKKYPRSDPRNPYNILNPNFDAKDPFNPYSPLNKNFDITDVNNPFNPNHPNFDPNNEFNPYNEKSIYYNPKYNEIKPLNPSDLDANDPKNYGKIVIGNPTSDKYGSYAKTGKGGKGGKGSRPNKGGNDNNFDNGGSKNPNNLVFDNNFTYTNDNPKLTGFEEKPKLTKEEEEYCNRINLEELRAAIYFQPSNSVANGAALKSLDKIVEAMRKCAVLEIQIAGHADADGSDNSNQSLSEKRAQAVLRYISGQGISDKRLKYNAYGEKYPAGDNTTPEGKQENRRTDIKVNKTY